MSKYKVFMPSGTVQTIVADNWNIDWHDGVGVLRFYIGDDTIAVFPPSGWHGVQNMEAYKKAVV